MTRAPVTIFACFSIFYLVLTQYCRHANYRDPTSKFFDPARAYERKYTVKRIQEADAFIQSAALLPTEPALSAHAPVMCIGVATIETLANKVLGYKKTDIAHVKEWEDGGWYRNRSIFDYTYLLNDCYATAARYIAMIEDDTLAVEGWYPRALLALAHVEKQMEYRAGMQWVFLRLFYAEDLFG
ncbi:hypothetical protein BJ875DRAFT_496803 [Amylocarpus encephaloides]|uniref:Mannosyltransferase n=1 Tax=Amylocarpus encephaloides TaxID=45428 RepID=A0A9P7YGD3_9HELO|nr:hypothetical protein BJ875DRAFT_496803 [Amylocarpus encephaloides]